MSTTSTNPSLTAAQSQVLALISSGFTATAAAERAGVHRNTVVNWLREDDFREALEQARGEKAILYWDQAEALAAEALANLCTMMRDPAVPANVRYKANVTVLEHSRHFTPQTCAIVRSPADPLQEKAEEKAEEKPETVHNNAQQQPVPKPPAASTTIHTGPKIGRNQPCPCGSGIKFKFCCLNKRPPQSENNPAA